jgi:lactose/L-arabinose transport system substrate-binding protein
MYRTGSRSGSLSRREFLRLAMVGMGAGLLAACGPQAAPATEAPAAATPATGTTPAAAGGSESGTITAWGWVGTYEGMKTQVEPFNKLYPNIKVDVKDMGYDDVHTNLLNAIVAGSGAPDLCAIDVLRLTNYLDGISDLSDQVKPYLNQFVPPTDAVGSYKGKFYGLATDSEPIGVFYRKDMWDQYGLKEEDFATWADLAAAGNKVYEASQGQVNLYSINANATSLIEVLAVEHGFPGYFFNEDDTKVIVDDPKMVEAVTVLKQLWDGKSVARDPAGGYSGDETTTLFKNGKLATQTVGPGWYPLVLTGQMPELSGKWRLMRAPAVKKDGPRVGYQYPTIFVLTQQSKLKAAAWELARISLLGDGARGLFDATKVLPAYKPLLDELKDKPDEYFGGQKIFELWDAIARDTPPVFFGTGFQEAQNIFGNHLQAVLKGEKTPEAGMHDAAEEMRAKLKKG